MATPARTGHDPDGAGVVQRRTPRAEPARWRPWVPAVVAWTVRLSALVTTLNLLRPRRTVLPAGEVLRPVADAALDGFTFAAAALSVGLALLLAGALRRRKRRAYWLAVALMAVGVLVHVRARSWGVAAVDLGVLGLLAWARPDFTARSERTARLVAVRVLVVLGLVDVLGGLLLTARTAPDAAWASRLGQTLLGLVGFTPALVYRHPAASNVTEIALNSLGALTAFAVLAVFLAPARKSARRSAQDEHDLRELLDRFGERDSLAYFALREDKAVVFSASRKAAVAYRVVGSVTLAAGDPLGDPEAWPGAIDAWLGEAASFAWTPGVVGASEAGATAYRRAGLDALELGDEAVLEVEEFTLTGRTMRGVRQAVNRVARTGYTLRVQRQQELAEPELARVVAAAAAFREGEVERGFSMSLGRLGRPEDPQIVLAQVHDGDGALVAVLGFVPWGARGLSLDVMRRSRDSENGTVEFAVAGVVDWAREHGIERISLNFAVFRSVFERGERVGAGPVLRLWHRLLMLASRWWQIESLYRANAKYHPGWAPRFVCFPRAGDLPRVSLAALEAEAFWQRPRLRWLRR